MAGFWRRRNAQLCRTVLTTRPSRHAEHQRGRHRRGWSCGCRPLRTADPGGTSHQGVWIAPFAAAQARLRLRRRAAEGGGDPIDPERSHADPGSTSTFAACDAARRAVAAISSPGPAIPDTSLRGQCGQRNAAGSSAAILEPSDPEAEASRPGPSIAVCALGRHSTVVRIGQALSSRLAAALAAVEAVRLRFSTLRIIQASGSSMSVRP